MFNNTIFENDICFCACKECPRYDKCFRGGGSERKGIYTISLLKEICNQNNDYQMFINTEK